MVSWMNPLERMRGKDGEHLVTLSTFLFFLDVAIVSLGLLRFSEEDTQAHMHLKDRFHASNTQTISI